MNNINYAMDVSGRLVIKATDTRTDIETVMLDDRNHIVNTGTSMITHILNPKSMAGSKLGVIKFGDDVGIGGTEFSPAPPVNTTNGDDQAVVFSVPPEVMSYASSDHAISLSFSMNGGDMTGTEDYIRYTSAAIYGENGAAFAYKRFPLLVFSKWMRVTIEWTITLTQNYIGDGDGGEVSPMTGVVIDADDTAVEVGEIIKIRGYERRQNGELKIIPNGDNWVVSNDNIALSMGSNGSVIISGIISGATTIQLRQGDFSSTVVIQIRESGGGG